MTSSSDATTTPPAVDGASAYKCPTCKSEGFIPSRMKNRCSFCDGTEGGHPPTEDEIIHWNWHQTHDDPCDEMMP